MAGLSKLDLSPGISFQRLVSDHLASLVSFQASPFSREFWLVCSFGRYSIRLNEDSVSWILQPVLGGSHKDFKVVHLSGWMFRFSVFSKNVGFMVYRLKKFICDSFSIFFALWSNDGPDWRRDFSIWSDEEDAKWITVSKSHQKKSFAQVVKDASMSGSAFSRLRFPSDYDPRGSPAPDGPALDPALNTSTIRKPVFNRLKYPANYFDINFRDETVERPGRRVLRWVPKQARDQRPPPQFISDSWAVELGPCGRCLAPGHGKSNCLSEIRCKRCFGYGHISSGCRAKISDSRAFRPKRRSTSKDSPPECDRCAAKPSSPSYRPPSPHRASSSPRLGNLKNPEQHPPPPLFPAPVAVTMANFPIDPHPFVPIGFNLMPREVIRESCRLRSFLAFSLDKANEDLAIAITEPKVDKEDFWTFAMELRAFLQEHHVRGPEIQ